MARMGRGPGRLFCGLADRWHLKLLLSLTTDTESSTVPSMNVHTAGRSMTHRKFLSLVQIHNQDGWRRWIPSIASNAFISLQDLDENDQNIRVWASWTGEKRVLSYSNLLQPLGAGQQRQPLQSEMNPSWLGVFQSEPLWRQQLSILHMLHTPGLRTSTYIINNDGFLHNSQV